MIDKNVINTWIQTLDEHRANLHVGGGALISSGYSKSNNELYDMATALRNMLVMYYSYETLTNVQIERVRILAQEISAKAKSYKTEKEKKTGKAPEKGDKKTRYDAANSLDVFASELVQNANNQVNNDIGDVKLSDSFKKIENDYLPSEQEDLAAAPIKQGVEKFAKEHKLYLKRLDYHYRACEAKSASESAAREQYPYLSDMVIEKVDDKSQFKSIGTENITKMVADFKANLGSLHRLQLLRYEDDEQFLDLYKKNRHVIKQVVQVFEWVKQCKDGNVNDQNQYHKFLKQMNYDNPHEGFNVFMSSLGLRNTTKDFDELAERISTFEMIGRHYDYKMNIVSNHEFATMEAKKLVELEKMSDYQLGQQIDKYRNKVNEKGSTKQDEDLLNMYVAVQKNREFAGIKVKPVGKGFKKYEKAYINREVGKDLKRRFKFLDFSARLGRKSMLDYYAGDLDIPVCVKAKLGKVSVKYNKETKYANISAGTHVGVLGTRVVGCIGAGVATADPLNWPKVGGNAIGSAEAYGARGVAKGWIGGKYGGIDARAMGHIAHAKAEASAGVGYVYATDDKGNVTAEGYGVNAKAGATAAVFQGKFTTGINILGIMVRWETEGYAIGVGAKAEARFTTSGCKLGAAGCLGLGAGFFLVIDWRGFVDKFKRWRTRSAISKETLKQKKAEMEAGIDNGVIKKNNVKIDNNFADDLLQAGNQAMVKKNNTGTRVTVNPNKEKNDVKTDKKRANSVKVTGSKNKKTVKKEVINKK